MGGSSRSTRITTVLPATIQGIERYLGSGLIKGIGPRTAGRIVGHFGVDTLRVIEEQPGRLVEVAGLGPKRTAMIGRAWEEQKAIKEVMVFLQGVGVSTSLAVRIYKKYGDGSISVVRDEPYRLAAEVWGIGFKTADAIAQAVGIPHDSPQRVQAGIQYTLSEAADNGHCYLPEPNLLTDAAQILGVPADLVRSLPGRPGRGRGGDPRTRPRHRRRNHSRGVSGAVPPRRNLRWPPRCCGWPARRPTGCPRSPRSTGTRRWRGCGPAPGRSWPPSRSRRCGWR